MSLSPCSTLFGEAAIVLGEPQVGLHVDRVYRPFSSQVFFDRDLSWGIYNKEGHVDPLAAYVRGRELSLVGQSIYQPEEATDADIVTEDHIYFGPFIPHYGHFIVTSLARSWYLDSIDARGAKLLCHSSHPIAAHLDGPYMGPIIRALGLEAEQFTRPTRPTRFTRLTIPGAAFLEQKRAYSSFVEPMHRIGDALVAERQRRREKVVYLSKARLGPGSVAHVTNEAEVEIALAEHNIDIISPERLTLAQQVDLFSSSSKVLGFVGSAFHTHILVRDPPAVVGVTFDNFINSNFLMLDHLNNCDSNYFCCNDNLVKVDVPGFGTARKIQNVASFVRDILEAARLPSMNFHPGFKPEVGLKKAVTMYNNNCVLDHSGESYRVTLEKLHQEVRPKAYLEIGTLSGETLRLSSSPSIAIDPRFQISSDVMGIKERCYLFQLESDAFFAEYDPSELLGAPLDLCFLDGMHLCEFLLRDFMNAEANSAPEGVIVLHDCLPVEIPMTDRVQNGSPPVAAHRSGWWTGDVWRTVAALKTYRPDLNVLCLDAAPTGLVLISHLNPKSEKLKKSYRRIVEKMMTMDLEEITVAAFLQQVETQPTSDFAAPGALAKALGR